MFIHPYSEPKQNLSYTDKIFVPNLTLSYFVVTCIENLPTRPTVLRKLIIFQNYNLSQYLRSSDGY